MNENPTVLAGIALMAVAILGMVAKHFWPQIQESLKASQSALKASSVARPVLMEPQLVQPTSTDNDRRIDAFGKALVVRDTITDLTSFDQKKLQANTEELAAALTQTKGAKSE